MAPSLNMLTKRSSVVLDGARSRKSIATIGCPRRAISMNPPPPRLPALGCVTARAYAVATAASTAFPPISSIRTPTCVAWSSTDTTMPKEPRVLPAPPATRPGTRAGVGTLGTSWLGGGVALTVDAPGRDVAPASRVPTSESRHATSSSATAATAWSPLARTLARERTSVSVHRGNGSDSPRGGVDPVPSPALCESGSRSAILLEDHVRVRITVVVVPSSLSARPWRACSISLSASRVAQRPERLR